MAKFRFELDALLRLRQREERDQQLIVAQLERDRVEIEGKIQSIQHAISSAKQDLRTRLTGQVADARTLRLQAASTLTLQAKAQEQAIRLAGVYKRLDTAREALARLAAKRRAVELLREQRYEQWRLDERRRETAENDDITGSRAAAQARTAQP